MERYGSQPDRPIIEWSSPGPDTGLEEPMFQLGLDGDGDGGESYPERPQEADCIFYLRTGFCGYGSRCRFNHPRDRNSVVGDGRSEGEFPERMGQPVCKFYMRTGSCRYGTSCKYHHPKHRGGPVSPISLNYFGYPLRPGEQECSYYVRTGECKFGISCKFHHPQPGDTQVPGPIPVPAVSPVLPTALYPAVQSSSGPSIQQYGMMASIWPTAGPPALSGSYGSYGQVLLHPGMVSFPHWSPYQVPLSPAASPSTQLTAGAAPFCGVTQLSPSALSFTGTYAPIPSSAGPSSNAQKEHMLPERPDQRECRYYIKTGNCKFGSSCRYNHPPEWNETKTAFAFSPMGLPMRPGALPCTYYTQHGICKFGRTCKYDHPMGTLSYSPSASSLAGMPVAPYPVGSSIGTPAPSSSSPDLQSELVSGLKDSLSTTKSSSTSTSSGSVCSVLSKSGLVSHSGVQQCSQNSAPLTGSSTTAHEGEAHASS